MRRRSEYCPQGHPITPENTLVEYRAGNRVQRCKECRKRQATAYQTSKEKEFIEMKKTERKQMMEVLAKLQERFTGSGVDHKWRQEETRYGVWLYNSYHAIDNGSYAGWADFALFFRWDEPLIEFKLHFIGKSAAYLNKKHDLRSYLTDTANWILEDCCKGQDVQKLYNGQLAS